MSDGVEKCRLADVRKPDDADTDLAAGKSENGGEQACS